MASKDDDLTLKGLARTLREHMDTSAAELTQMRAQFSTQFAEVGARIDELRGEIGTVATIVRDLTQVVARQHDEIVEHRQQIRQIYARMEQHDARFEGMARDIRRILDALERRGGDGGRRET